MARRLVALLGLVWLLCPWRTAAQSSPQPTAHPVRLAVAGLVHGHVDRFVRLALARPGLELVGIFESNAELRQKAPERLKVPADIVYADLATMLDRTKPDLVAAFTTTGDHPMVVDAAASRHVHVMMEKPLAVSVAAARAIARAASRGGIRVIVNYETTWYPSHAAIWRLVKEEHAAGNIRKMVAMDGHSGPKAIKVQPEFFNWLVDPLKNGGGALFDFGCYGANLMTWLMDDARPISVIALTQHLQPDTYRRVDDEATILVEYPKAQGIIQASWNWPVGRKDLEVYGERGYTIATGGSSLRVRLADDKDERRPALDPRADTERDEIAYLMAVVRGATPSGPSSLATNIVVTEILAAARDSARTGRRVRLASAPVQ
jgi:predicted dehydrogenase